MCELIQAVEHCSPRQAKSIKKHLTATGIEGWDDLTRTNLYDLRDEITQSGCGRGTARTYLATLRGIMNRYRDEVALPEGWEGILRAKKDTPIKTYLTGEELTDLEGVATTSDKERVALLGFLIEAYTGMRLSDVRSVDDANINGGMLTYVSIKSKVKATVPCSDKVAGWIHEYRNKGVSITTAGHNEAIKRLCRRAGITSIVKVRKGSEDLTGEKWMFVSSHTARISFCTNLAILGMSLDEIRQLAGHTSVIMTQNYICRYEVKLTAAAQKFFGV